MTTSGHRFTCPRCGRPIGVAFGRRVAPHNDLAGARCSGSRLPIGDAIAEHTERQPQ